MPPENTLLSVSLAIIAGVIGACVGSFLNVVIYRLPREDCNIHQPRRSFCPSCKHQIPWHLNIPIFAWFFLQGKCQNCKAPITWRYPAVEALTAALFLCIWMRFGGVANWQAAMTAMVYWVMISIFIAATFIDLEHMIIPDVLTVGGAASGIMATALVPTLMGAEFSKRAFHAVGQSIFGAFVGYGLLRAAISIGKLLFGRRSIQFEGRQDWTLTEHENHPYPILEIGEEERIPWPDIFFRDSDRLRFFQGEIVIDHRETLPFRELVFCFDHFFVDEKRFEIEEVKHLGGKASSVIMSREAMGFGDAKFEACIGAFLGWKAVPFSLFAGSILGCLGWVMGKCLRRDGVRQLPFAPYLAAGAVIWLFWGPALIDWYLALGR